MYTTWDYYQEEYLGRAITDEDVFETYSQRACAVLDDITRGRIPAFLTEATDPAIQNATCAVIEVLYNNDLRSRDGGRVITSESNDGFSQSFAAPVDPATGAGRQALNASIMDAATLYLRYTGLLYAGGITVV